MLAFALKGNPKQHALIKDTNPFVVGICPRRAGKSWAAAMAALITGEAKPGSISIIISLNLKQLKRLYWQGGPSGLFTLANQFKLNISWHHTMLRWEHENGSIGYLMGAEDPEQLEVLRGLEADLYIIDECKSFEPGRLSVLIHEILGPQRNTRKGRIIMIGTPGHVQAGPFYEASCPTAVDDKGRRFSVDIGEADPHGRDVEKNRLWSRHAWTLQDNTAVAHQWDEALLNKEANNWADDDPIWRREYLGEWTTAQDGLVYTYATAKSNGVATWTPEVTDENPTGLPEEGAPWRLIGGLDLGFQSATAFVLAAYSSRLKQLRHVVDVSASHMLPDDVDDMLRAAYAKYGTVEMIYADVGNLGKMLVEGLVRKGHPIERADKREKYDHIEMINSAFVRGEIKIVQGTTLEHQLLTNAWDLKDGSRDDLARWGRLREDDSIPNDSTDAFLYLYRGSLHRFGAAEKPPGPAYLTPEWVELYEREQLKRARESFRPKEERFLIQSAPAFVQVALQKRDRWLPSPHSSNTFS